MYFDLCGVNGYDPVDLDAARAQLGPRFSAYVIMTGDRQIWL
jgi:hypothetical protein